MWCCKRRISFWAGLSQDKEHERGHGHSVNGQIHTVNGQIRSTVKYGQRSNTVNGQMRLYSIERVMRPWLDAVAHTDRTGLAAEPVHVSHKHETTMNTHPEEGQHGMEFGHYRTSSWETCLRQYKIKERNWSASHQEKGEPSIVYIGIVIKNSHGSIYVSI